MMSVDAWQAAEVHRATVVYLGTWPSWKAPCGMRRSKVSVASRADTCTGWQTSCSRPCSCGERGSCCQLAGSCAGLL